MDELIRQIDEFRAHCKKIGFMDIMGAWHLLDYVERTLKHRDEPIDADDPDNAIYWVDIPMDYDDGCWKNVGVFESWPEALKFAREQYGCDEEGRIRIITMGVEPDE